MRNDIREKIRISVSVGECKRAKLCALYEHEEGLIEHYGKLWEYIQAILESNPYSTCHIDVDVNDDGQPQFSKMYVCFKGLKDKWKAGCKRVIGIDGYFLTHVSNTERKYEVSRVGRVMTCHIC